MPPRTARELFEQVARVLAASPLTNTNGLIGYTVPSLDKQSSAGEDAKQGRCFLYVHVCYSIAPLLTRHAKFLTRLYHTTLAQTRFLTHAALSLAVSR